MLDKTPDKLHTPHAAMVAILVMTLLGSCPALAGDTRHAGDHDQARQALETGKILPLQTILAQVERGYPGQIMEVDLERAGESWYYEIKLLRPGGALVKLKVDARDGKVLDIKEKNGKNRHSGEAR